MAAVLIYADIVNVAEDYLEAALTARGVTAPVGIRVPNPRPAYFVVLRELGGARHTVVSRQAHLGMEAWAADDNDAKDLGTLTYGLIHGMANTTQGGVVIYGTTDIAGLSSLPDPISGSPRYVATIAINYRGTPG
jgi:hypothetical protein